jgi:hypothetical protein
MLNPYHSLSQLWSYLPSDWKERERKKEIEKRGQWLKSKRGETSYEEAPCFKRRKEKKEDEIYKLLGEILSKERMKGDHIFL